MSDKEFLPALSVIIVVLFVAEWHGAAVICSGALLFGLWLQR
jgi:hypothetical protein